MKYIALIPLILAITACQKQTDTKNSEEPIQVDHVISVNITYDRPIAHKVEAITAVPNNEAPWLSSLFIIDEKKQLLRGKLESGDFKLIATNIEDITPLARKNTAGVIIALTSDNVLTGFKEINDEGDYEDIAFVKTPQKINGFCKTKNLMEQRIYGFDTNNSYALDIINTNENPNIKFLEIETPTATTDPCLLKISGDAIDLVQTPKNILSASLLEPDTLIFTTHESRNRPRLFMQKGDETMAIDITGGLSTEAPSQIDSFTIVHNNLGGVLRNGAVMITDNASERVIYISLDLLNRRISDATVLLPQK